MPLRSDCQENSALAVHRQALAIDDHHSLRFVASRRCTYRTGRPNPGASIPVAAGTRARARNRVRVDRGGVGFDSTSTRNSSGPMRRCHSTSTELPIVCPAGSLRTATNTTVDSAVGSVDKDMLLRASHTYRMNCCPPTYRKALRDLDGCSGAEGARQASDLRHVAARHSNLGACAADRAITPVAIVIDREPY